MANQLFRVRGGFSDGNVYYISGTGAPGGDAGAQDAAPVGSKYADFAAGEEYIKILAGAGTDKWRRQASVQDIANTLSGTSWREPALVADFTGPDLATIIADLNADNQIQGATVTAGDRLLLGFGASPNVYIVGGSPGAWTLTEDPNEETAGDTLRVLSGNEANRMFYFNGTNWIWVGQQNSDEEQFLRAFVGKGAAGAVLPTYSTNNYVANNDDLSTAIGKLDAQAFTNATNISANATAISGLQTTATNLQNELDAVETGVGLNPDGTYAAPSGTSYLDTSTNVMDALVQLDAAVTVAGNDIVETSATGVTAPTTVDSVSVDSTNLAKWLVFIQEDAVPANKRAVEVSAIHDGTPLSDATDPDFDVYNVLRRGAKITGLNISVQLTGTGASQAMELVVSSTDAVTVRALRLSV